MILIEKKWLCLYTICGLFITQFQLSKIHSMCKWIIYLHRKLVLGNGEREQRGIKSLAPAQFFFLWTYKVSFINKKYYRTLRLSQEIKIFWIVRERIQNKYFKYIQFLITLTIDSYNECHWLVHRFIYI